MPSTLEPYNPNHFVNLKEGPPFGYSLELCKANFTVNEGRAYKFLFRANLVNNCNHVECQITYLEGDVNEIEIRYTFNPIVEAFGGSLFVGGGKRARSVDLGQFQPYGKTINLIKGVHSAWDQFSVPDNCIELLRNLRNMRNLIRNNLDIDIINPIKHFAAQESHLSLQATFASLFMNEDMSDLKILCDEKEFPVHKFILKVRSIVFKTMFASNFTETTSKILKIENTDAKTMEKFLRFLYTDQIKPEELDCPLLILADQYQVDSLTNQCIQVLQTKMDSENVMEVCYAAFLISNEKLMRKARIYALVLNGIKKPPFWKELEESNPQLVLKIMNRIFFEE